MTGALNWLWASAVCVGLLGTLWGQNTTLRAEHKLESFKVAVAMEAARVQEISLAKERDLADKVKKAQNDTAQKLQTLETSRNAARSELDRLRVATNSSSSDLSQATRGSLEARVSALEGVFADCGRELAELAGKADRHAAEAEGLRQAWPQ